MGEPQRAVARPGEDGVALAVALEGAAGAVVGPAVGLDDESARLEDEVDAEARNPRARLRAFNAMRVAEGEHELLEL